MELISIFKYISYLRLILNHGILNYMFLSCVTCPLLPFRKKRILNNYHRLRNLRTFSVPCASCISLPLYRTCSILEKQTRYIVLWISGISLIFLLMQKVPNFMIIYCYLASYSTANSETLNYVLELRHVSATSFQKKTYIK